MARHAICVRPDISAMPWNERIVVAVCVMSAGWSIVTVTAANASVKKT